MGLKIPARATVVSALQSYVRGAIPDLDPSTSRRSYIGGLVKSLGSALHDWYAALKRYADNEPFPQSATRDFLYAGWWRDITKLDPLPAAPAAGRVVITGTDGTILDAGTELASGATTYTVDLSTAVIAQSLAATSLTRSGTTAIFETAAAHNLASGMSLTISGATETDYNVTAEITVTAENEFTYAVSGSPATPATGSPIVSGSWGNAVITATTTGPGSNIDADTALTVLDSPAGLDPTALVTWGGIADGVDDEDPESYRARVLEALGTDFGMFSAAEIKIIAKTVPGVTRVWVREATLGGTNGVYEGQVVVAFMRDNDANPFPSPFEVEVVRDAVLGIKPAHTADEDVMVVSPTKLAVDFSFNTISPDTASMRRAIRATLQQFFQEQVDYGTSIPEDDYRCAIKATYDREARIGLRSFSLVGPTGDIAVGSNELPALGDVSF